MREQVSSWGRTLHAEHEVREVYDRYAPLPLRRTPTSTEEAPLTWLPRGNGRSYGDSCLNAGGGLLLTRKLDRFIAFDPATGVLACEGGVLLSDILRLVVPQGWFLVVTPGTQYISLGGAIANDVHGKNHHLAGTFGAHLRHFELLRSDGARLLCARDENPHWFAATLGGLGLTGLITWAELQLRRIANPWIAAETIRFATLEEFFEISKESDRNYEYTVAWVDCAGGRKALGRGRFIRGKHAPSGVSAGTFTPCRWHFPIRPPISLVNAFSLKAFNALYYHRQRARASRRVAHYQQFFYPLDGILEWNRLYGPRGFYQYQCVIPAEAAGDATRELLNEIGRSGMGSFLAVLKVFGDVESPGMLSFPRPGTTLALDFPNRGTQLHRLFSRLDTIVGEAGGRLYPAKDGRMSGALFRSGYPKWHTFLKYIDPQFSSSFWRRVMKDV